MSKRRITALFPEALMNDFFAELKAAGLSVRKKSVFFEKGLIDLLLLDDSVIMERLVNEGFGVDANDVSDVFSITDDTSVELEGLVFRLRQLDPLLEGIQSRLMRSAVLYVTRR